MQHKTRSRNARHWREVPQAAVKKIMGIIFKIIGFPEFVKRSTTSCTGREYCHCTPDVALRSTRRDFATTISQSLLSAARIISITEGFGMGTTFSTFSGMPLKRSSDAASTGPERNPCFFSGS